MARRQAGADLEVVRGDVVNASPALDAEARIKEALRDGKDALWRLAEALYDFDHNNGWAALGYKDLSAWLNDPEIDMTRGTYYRYVNTWRKLVIEGGVKPKQLEVVSQSKAALVADDIVEGRITATAALKDVQSLSANELREKYEKPRRGRPPKHEPHNGSPTPNRAIKAADELPWDFIEGALGRGNLELREARLREALQALLEWRDAYLARS